jgi:hypothetical protein
MTWEVQNIVLQTEGIKGDIYMNCYKSVDNKEFIITLANKAGTKFELPKDVKAIMDEYYCPEPKPCL